MVPISTVECITDPIQGKADAMKIIAISLQPSNVRPVSRRRVRPFPCWRNAGSMLRFMASLPRLARLAAFFFFTSLTPAGFAAEIDESKLPPPAPGPVEFDRDIRP